jgi:intracellular sulfur oxidation DsrE/DsrF family protein
MSLRFTTDSAPRRSFLGRLAGGAVALAGGTLITRRADALPLDGEPWLKALPAAKHKQVFDAPEINDGFPLIFTFAYLDSMTKTYTLKPGEATAVLVMRHSGIPMALNDSIWAKYKLGEMFKVTDPATKMPATRNIFYKSKPGDIMLPEASGDKLMAKGVAICVCNIALTVLSGKAAPTAKVTPEQALKEWTAGVIPGSHVVPSGVLAVGRSQEAGCNYCFAG